MTGTPTAAHRRHAAELLEDHEPDDNALDQVQTEIDQAPGKINRLSVAVLLDSSAVKPADVANWTKQIQTAVGYDPRRAATRCKSRRSRSATPPQKAAKAKLTAASGGSGQGGMIDLCATS